ncbi:MULTISPECIES: L-carnitine/gamma-butyrobetaine antiporter [Shewanella]|jgi:L-carnitine/gamma-butyrobetaine antiporter|uniref:L-carnitine/gamma-butyrobetaine antiport BCCT transporter n=1 Tax=Shewanella chilikensis TaxID=558541 RepID=A0A6G7LWW8_9GAMM|nr:MULTISPECIES: L-carnitine/gamma-butyrobetaine antiporter [Shewanella]MCA0950634.1 L-carnitine/gamma-butyrobetaine antiport BCCT transporter [Shewanella chilikensis]MCE9853725.1 L-carnitine/gamma-butyrobetaine antiport BCCT transporter [Shewanella chilikensis]MCL1164128.1 L-carnitine/gamma-butyrobetaine antiport BCCT transporter [Shewanella chilikensis]QIJ06262.1 L-carnitine/gamma-butyrobetaine antiport BCCT transporter [Shewanella chilikensis]HCD13181.1 L-carnitine/gamma-butyrobetaine antip
MSENKKIKKAGIEAKIFFPSLLVVILLSYFTVRDLDAANEVISAVFHYLTHSWGWAFEWYMIVMLAGWLWLLFGPYANNRLGNEEPEFSTGSWIFLMFASCTSAAVLFWGSLEIYYYVSYPPFEMEPLTVQAKEFGLAYSLFHWGPLPWAGYAFFSVALGYFLFVKKMDVVRPSGTLYPIMGKKCEGIIGTIIDNIYVVALILAMGTSLGLATPLVTECIQYLFGIPRTIEVDATIISAWIIFNAICVAFGLQKGIKIASDLRSYLSIIILAWVLIIGATTFTVNYFTDSIGVLLMNMGRMLFYTASVSESSFPQDWTVFYWAWWVVYGIQMCIFLAKISRGRTVRQLCLAMVGGLTASTWLLWTILGSNTLNLMNENIVNMPALIEQYGAARAIIETWAALPMSTITMWMFFILCFLATVTLINACSYTLAMSTCKGVDADNEPPVWVRVGWSVLVGVIGIVLLALGGLKPLQTAIIAGGAPLIFVNIMIIISFLKDSRKNNWKS